MTGSRFCGNTVGRYLQLCFPFWKQKSYFFFLFPCFIYFLKFTIPFLKITWMLPSVLKP